jgi:predicted exporter
MRTGRAPHPPHAGESGRQTAAIVIWALLMGIAALVVIRARYAADLSAFLPRAPTASQRLLVQQLRQGVASRLIIIAIEGGSGGTERSPAPGSGGAAGQVAADQDAAARARLSEALAQRLRADPQFISIENGDQVTARRDQAFLFAHRYLLSSTVTPQRFEGAGLRDAIQNSIDTLASPAGLLAEEILPSDPTGEMMTLLGQLGQRQAPRTLDGVWASKDGSRALLIAQTRAAGSDTDGQELALRAIRSAFETALAAQHVRASLQMTGPGVFGVEARASIKHEVTRLSIVSSLLILTLLVLVYRSIPPLVLGLVPVASGALVGIAAVALGFGVVQGVTLGFGVTLIGEGVDYSIYLFVQSRSRVLPTSSASASASAPPAAAWAAIWPIIRLGMLTSMCGFASLLPSGFPGLAQLGLYSLTGVLAAGLATRFVLPALLPRNFVIRDLSPIGHAAQRILHPVAMGRAAVGLIAIAAAALLYVNRDHLFNRELSALSPVPAAAQQLDGRLRGDLGAPDVRYLVVVSAPDMQSALRGAEQVGTELESLVSRNVISGYESPALYLPSQAVQRRRQQSLPPPDVLRTNLRQALAGLPLRASRLQPFLRDVEAERNAPLMTPQSLAGTSFASVTDSLLVREGSEWHALLPLDAPTSGPHAFVIDFGQVRQAVSAAAPARATVLDLKGQANALYATYLREAVELSLLGLAAITILLLLALRSPARVIRVLLPLAAAVLAVAAGLVLLGRELTLLHVIGMLLIVAVGSNYALFFDRRVTGSPAVTGSAFAEAAGREQASRSLTLASLVVANGATVLGFGVLAFSSVPVLRDLGSTVAPGAFLALVFAALLARREPMKE